MNTAAIKKPDFNLVNIGFMSRATLNALVAQFPKNARITMSEISLKVEGPDGRKVLSAAKLARGNWHVRAAEGMVQPRYPQHLA